MLSRVTLSLLGVVLLVLLHAFLKTILSRVYFFFALFPSPFFGGPFPLLFIRSNFTFRLLSSGSSNSMSIFRIPSGYHDVNRGPTNAFFKSFLPVGAFVSFSAVWNILAYSRRDQGYLFLVRRGNRRHSRSRSFCVSSSFASSVCFTFFRLWFSFRKLQSFHTKRKKHISPALYEK